MTGIITNIQSYSIHDGPGIRTTVFMKGCQLACKWCCNPETQGDAKVIPGKEAPTGQQWFWGKEVTVDQLVAELIRDRVFYDQSGGGVTISGGDPMYQPDFVYEVCEKLQAEGIHVCMDTYGYCSWDTIKQFIPVVDLWLYDIKSIDRFKHYQFTGIYPDVPMDNLARLANRGCNIQNRLAIIPEFNDTIANMKIIINFMIEHDLLSISIFPYHVYGADKYKRLGRTYEMPLINTTDADIQWAVDMFTEAGINVTIGS